MTEVQKQTLIRAINYLSALKVDYKIIAPDGAEYGNLEVVPKNEKASRRARPRTKYGTYSPLYKTAILNAKPGDVLSFSLKDIQGGEGDMRSLRSAVTAYASAQWGNGSYVSSSHDDTIEVLRVV